MNLYYCSCNHDEESYLFLLFDSFVKLGNLFGLIYFLVQCNAVDKMVSYLRNDSNDNWVNIVSYQEDTMVEIEKDFKENYNIIDGHNSNDEGDNNSNNNDDDDNSNN